MQPEQAESRHRYWMSATRYSARRWRWGTGNPTWRPSSTHSRQEPIPASDRVRLDQQLRGGVNEVALQIGRLRYRTSDIRAVDDQCYLIAGAVGITNTQLGDDRCEPRLHFLFVVSGDNPARMVVVGKLRHQIKKGAATKGGVRNPFRDSRQQRLQQSARVIGVLLFNVIPPRPEQPIFLGGESADQSVLGVEHAIEARL